MAGRLIGRLDRSLAITVLLIALLGLYNLASAGRPLGARLHITHGAHLLVGLALMIGVAAVHYRNLEGLAYPIFWSTVLLLLATAFFGKLVNGSRRWLVLGPVNIQTSDLAKLAVIVIVAKTFHMRRWEQGLSLRGLFRPLNVSRPLVVVVAVLVLVLFGDALKPASVQKLSGRRYRTADRLRAQDPTVTIGRKKAEGIDVRLPLSGVETPHARIERVADGHYVIHNLSTSAGLFVGDQRVDAPRRLHDGDIIRVGLNQRAELRFKAPVEKVRPLLPWVALLGAIWLFVAFYQQVKKGRWVPEDILAPIDVVIIPFVLILIQPDLGTALVVLLIAFSMILYVGIRPVSVGLLASFSVVTGVIAWLAVLKPYQKERVLSFLNPTSDLAGAGYHQHQSLIAVGSGELWGKGHGAGTQTQLSFLPEQQTDFIFSVWAEEQGFLGCLVVVALFAALLLIALRVAASARDRFGALLAIGVTALVFWHTVINMLMVLRLAPVVGVPLPLWSNGGSFVVTTMLGLGMLLNVSMRRHFF